jgi:hypothetical protein
MKTATLVVTAMILVTSLGATATAKKDDSVHGAITWYQTNSRGAATHHGDSKPTFVQGAVLRLTKGSHHTWVRVNDVCDGSACRTLDVDPDTFTRLGSSSGQGVIRVDIACGKRGQRPMRKCLAGEG